VACLVSAGNVCCLLHVLCVDSLLHCVFAKVACQWLPDVCYLSVQLSVMGLRSSLLIRLVLLACGTGICHFAVVHLLLSEHSFCFI
jgi:hypothetical protein